MARIASIDNVFVRVNEKQYGPFSPRELRAMIDKGKFSENDLIWSEDQDQWITAADFNALRYIFPSEEAAAKRPKRVIAVGGGKGGVGKTVLTSSIGVGLASLGKDVVMVDADLGGANLHTVMGILEPEHTFFDFYTLAVEDIKDIVLSTPVERLKLISGACGTLGLANPKYQQKLKFIRQLREIDADFILLDLGAGSSFNVIDFFLTADEGIVVTNPEPMAIQECFNFIKICLLRRLQLAFRGNERVMEILESDELNRPGRIHIPMSEVLKKVQEIDQSAAGMMEEVLATNRPKLILNMVMEKDDIKEGIAIQTAAAELLSIDVEFLGYITYDQGVRNAVRELRPFLLQNPQSPASQDLAKLISVKILGQSKISGFFEKRKLRKQLMEQRAEYPEINLQQQAPICSIKCFYWGDCDYQNGGHPCAVRHLEPIFKQ
ncbi:P-loop NTPase [candidate division KSB1 bacterium]|nr:P-loop NTPase [candidate division KSB1 bacterium]